MTGYIGPADMNVAPMTIASLADLTKAMDINPPSLYAAFGDKEHLFLEAIERYQRARGASCPYCEEPTARAAVQNQ